MFDGTFWLVIFSPVRCSIFDSTIWGIIFPVVRCSTKEMLLDLSNFNNFRPMGAELAQSRFVVLLMSLPRAFFIKKHDLPFFRCPCRGQILFKNCVFVTLKGFARVKNDRIWMVLSLRSMLELLVLKKYAECTSRHVKRTSGARAANFVFNEVELSLTDV